MKRPQRRKRIIAAFKSHDNLFSIINERKMMWYGNVTRSSGLEKTILQGTMPRGRQKADKRREEKITSGKGQTCLLLGHNIQLTTEIEGR